jgi:hypothetical protein
MFGGDLLISVSENTNITGTDVIADTTIIFRDPLTVGNGADVTRNNISNLLAIWQV